MSDFRIDQITNQAGTAGPDIAGITTFSGSSGLLMPSGDTRGRYSGADGEIVKDGLVLWLDAGRAESYGGDGTTWRDLSGNGNNGTLVNGVGFSAEEGGSLSFDGSNDYSSHPYSSLLDLGTQFTISSFIKFNNLSTISPIFTAPNVVYGVFTEGYMFYYDTGTLYGMNTNTLRLQFGQNNWAWNIYASNGISITDNNWHFVSVTASNLNTSNPTITFYIDGNSITGTFWNASSKATIRYSSDINSPRVASIFFPVSYEGPYYLNGNIANTSIYNRALTPQEIQQNYNALKGRYT